MRESHVTQVARAVYHLHSCGVCHRDIKPENVVLTSTAADAQVKLIDFGAAVSLEENEQVGDGYCLQCQWASGWVAVCRFGCQNALTLSLTHTFLKWQLIHAPS